MTELIIHIVKPGSFPVFLFVCKLNLFFLTFSNQPQVTSNK